jgi:hypothetical protein
MKTRNLILGAALLALLAVQMAFSWGNATHMYYAKQLGTKFGYSNMNEMYGAVLPDCYTLVPDANNQFMYAQTHDNAMPVWLNAHGPVMKSIAFGYMTHNQTWGADYSAHIKSFAFPNFISPVTGKRGGYAVEKGVELLPQLAPVLMQILLDAGVPIQDGDGNPLAEPLAYGIGAELGHDLSETAVDLLVKRNLDPAIGLRMVLAAKCRPANAGELLASVYAPALHEYSGLSLADATAFIIASEKTYQQYIIQYGTAFSLPEKQTIALLAQQTAPVAESWIEITLAQYGLEGIDVTVTPEQVSTFINAAIAVVKPDYAREVSRTLAFVERGLRTNGVCAPFYLLAKEGEENADASGEELVAPTEFTLAQNSPNPFNPTTTISYHLPAASKVRLSVYDMLGREVAVLVDEEMGAGSHQARFDASGLASGTYIYRIEAGSFVQAKRMVLLK